MCALAQKYTIWYKCFSPDEETPPGFLLDLVCFFHLQFDSTTPAGLRSLTSFWFKLLPRILALPTLERLHGMEATAERKKKGKRIFHDILQQRWKTLAS